MELELRVPGFHANVVAWPIEADSLLEQWRAERRYVESSGRWPLCVSCFGPLEADWIEMERDGSAETPRNRSVGDILAGAVGISAKDALESVREYVSHDDLIESELRGTEHRFGSAPAAAWVRESLGESWRWRDLDKLLLEWEDGKSPRTPPRDDHLDWYVPTDHEYPHLALVPAVNSEDCLAFFSFWAEDFYPGAEASALIAIVGQWRRSFGAELVANWGTMLQFVVNSPPRTLEEAWEVAWQHATVAPYTVWGPGISVRDHARTLVDRQDWFLHERP